MLRRAVLAAAVLTALLAAATPAAAQTVIAPGQGCATDSPPAWNEWLYTCPGLGSITAPSVVTVMDLGRSEVGITCGSDASYFPQYVQAQLTCCPGDAIGVLYLQPFASAFVGIEVVRVEPTGTRDCDGPAQLRSATRTRGERVLAALRGLGSRRGDRAVGVERLPPAVRRLGTEIGRFVFVDGPKLSDGAYRTRALAHVRRSALVAGRTEPAAGRAALTRFAGHLERLASAPDADLPAVLRAVREAAHAVGRTTSG